MAPDNPLWLAPTVAAIVLAALAWTARAHLREWRAYRAGTLLPRDRNLVEAEPSRSCRLTGAVKA
jgi:hypothetical protein